MNDDDEFEWWELGENEWVEMQRNAGTFRDYLDEVRARLVFRTSISLKERGVFDKPSRPRPARAPRKPSLASRLKAAQKAGAKDVDVRPDGTVTAAFGERAAGTNQQDEVEAWVKKHAH